MATALKLKADIKKLKAAINSKATPKSYLPKLKEQLSKAENELEAVEKGAKPRKTSTTKKTAATLSALEKLIKKKEFAVYRGAGVDLKKDANEGAMKSGRRISKGLKSNQYGSAADNKGNVYYEYRPNRLDVKQPKRKQTYPKLEAGGKLYARGGGVDKKYTHFAVRKSDNLILTGWDYKGVDKESIAYYTKGDLVDMDVKPSDYKILTKTFLKAKGIDPFSWDNWVSSKKMADGGSMAKGGKMFPHKIVLVKPDGEQLDVAVFAAKGDAYSCANHLTNSNSVGHTYTVVSKKADGGELHRTEE